VAAAISAVCNGSFAAMSKLVPEQHPWVFNSMFGVGVCISSVALIPVLELWWADFSVRPDGVGSLLRVNPVAMLCGVLLGAATFFSFLAIPRIGLATAQVRTMLVLLVLPLQPLLPLLPLLLLLLLLLPLLLVLLAFVLIHSAAQGIWGGAAIAVSFAWGVLGPAGIGEAPQSALGSVHTHTHTHIYIYIMIPAANPVSTLKYSSCC